MNSFMNNKMYDLDIEKIKNCIDDHIMMSDMCNRTLSIEKLILDSNIYHFNKHNELMDSLDQYSDDICEYPFKLKEAYIKETLNTISFKISDVNRKLISLVYK
jgi:hypothetical protein